MARLVTDLTVGTIGLIWVSRTIRAAISAKKSADAGTESGIAKTNTTTQL